MKFMNLVNFGLAPEVADLVWHVPNGEKRDAKTAIKLKKMGVKPGVPDIDCAVVVPPYAGLKIEMKPDVGGRVDPDQERIHTMLREQGYAVAVAHGAAEAFEILERYLDGRFTSE